MGSFLWGAPEIGHVIEIIGTATASQPTQRERDLSVGSKIYTKDTIATADESAVRIQFLDKSTLDLTANTRYYIDEYQYGSLGKNRSQSELLEGGLRLLSGSIKPDPSEYSIKTPNATIGLMGTLVEAQMAEDTLYVACTQGHVQIQNSAGTIVIGEDMEQYATVTSYQRRPQIFINPPTNLIRPNVMPGIRH